MTENVAKALDRQAKEKLSLNQASGGVGALDRRRRALWGRRREARSGHSRPALARKSGRRAEVTDLETRREARWPLDRDTPNSGSELNESKFADLDPNQEEP